MTAEIPLLYSLTSPTTPEKNTPGLNVSDIKVKRHINTKRVIQCQNRFKLTYKSKQTPLETESTPNKIAYDSCVRWFHLKCALGSNFPVKKIRSISFKCTLCIAGGNKVCKSQYYYCESFLYYKNMHFSLHLVGLNIYVCGSLMLKSKKIC